ncbi:MAG TPA: hypothetical protein VKA63_09285 [Candidatus Krumholzibacteria bacterium]|nr:hypothetical protein [Candidatus Krumholzibacteria bacterium]
MRRLSSLVVLSLALWIAACAAPSPRTDSEKPIELSGTYRGTYWITDHEGTSEQYRESGTCTMRFDDGHYEIEGDRIGLPPEGGGEYRVEGDQLQLTDTMQHTADFDWSLILSGRFQIDAGDDGYIRLEQHDLAHNRLHELELRKLDR